MSECVQLLSAALEDEFGPKPRTATLATVDEQGGPHARTVVCRRLLDDGSVCAVSDARSDKNRHVRLRPASELVFWLPKLRQQFRLRGNVKLLGPDSTDPLRSDLWAALTDASRALFFWPQPGAARRPEDEFVRAVPVETSVPATFEVLILLADTVHRLDLSPHPHQLRRWRRQGGAAGAWEVEDLNP
jgi:PPOX class probable FMN-dependent enzyme